MILICFLACSQESFIKMQKKAQEQENDGSKRPSYVDSDYEVFSETIFLQNMVYQPIEERNAFFQLTNDEDNDPKETSVILLNEPSDNDTKNPPSYPNDPNNNEDNANNEKNPFLYKPKRKTKNPKLIEYSQQDFYPLKNGDIIMSKEGDQWLIEIQSKALKRFLKDQNDKDRQIQTFTFNDTKTQIAQFKGKISSYVYTTNDSDLSLRPFYESFLLEKKSDNVYTIGDKALDAIEISKCQMVLKKHSTDKLDSQHKAISIDLDFKKERFKSDTELFLECQS
ncbi:putative lipoprotein [Helicobacter pylori]|uniref:Putative lipoprotein n=2 Tax=Helicobacter pylori TaxID=210 RepID=A0A377IQC8_HELPX|nr:putative lipoprotein [Helicobacter pylori]